MNKAEECIQKYEEKHGSCPDDVKDDLKSFFGYYETRDMYCPLCKSRLIFNEWVVVDGVCGDENRCKYTCENDICELHKHDSFWDDNGDFYSGKLSYSDCKKLMPTDEYAAKNSSACNSEKAIYKKGLKDKTYLHPILCLWFLKPYIEHCYIADDWGNIKKHSYKLKFLKKGKDSKSYYIHYISGVHMFFFILKQYNINKKNFLNNPTSYNKSQLLKEFEEKWGDKRWWRLLFKFLIRTFQKKIYNMVKSDLELLKSELRKQKLKKINKSNNIFVSLHKKLKR